MAICPCDRPIDDTCLDIEPGLATLPRQARGFGEVKSRLLASIAAEPSLRGWTGEAEQDLGVMLLDMWAYVLDVSQFYDAKITDEFYLGTAKRDLSTHRIIKLLGYKPAPPLAAEATMVAEVTQADPLTLPAKSGFRSEAFDDQPPQVFQLLAPTTLDPARNRWKLGEIDDDTYPGRVLLRPSENGVPKRGILAFTLGGAPHHASAIEGRATYVGADDRKMAEVLLEDPLDVPDGTKVDQMEMRLMGLRAGPTPLDTTFEQGVLYLDTIYPQLRKGDLAVLETEDELIAFQIDYAEREDLILLTPSDANAETSDADAETSDADAETPDANAEAKVKIPVPVSKVTMGTTSGPTLTEEMAKKMAEDRTWRLHFNPVRVGRLRAPYKTEIALADLDEGARLEKPRYPHHEPLSGTFMAMGAAGAGASIAGKVTRDPLRRETGFTPDPGQPAFEAALRTPVSLFGNLLHTVRTEQIENEVLGSADAGSAQNRFKLKKAPLTWITDSAAASNRRPLIEVRVDGVLWNRAETFYTASPKDRVYTLETDAKGDTFVVFGDGERGERPSSGTGNVTASYGHGGGAAKPPPGSITQTARPIKGLGRVVNPVACVGGADAEKAEDIRSNAPATVLTLGRAVSMQDFTALARTFPGVLNVASGWAWHPERQRAVVTLWVAENGALDLLELQSWLRGMAATDTPLAIEIATPISRSLAVSIAVDAAHRSEDVHAAARSALADPMTGLLATRQVPIGGVIYRSAIVKAVQTVPGVASVPSIMLDGVEMAWAVKAKAGTYADFTDSITVA